MCDTVLDGPAGWKRIAAQCRMMKSECRKNDEARMTKWLALASTFVAQQAESLFPCATV